MKMYVQGLARSIFVICLAVLLSACTINGSQTNITDLLNNLQNSYRALWNIVEGASYLIGGWFGLMAIFQLKVYGEMRTMMSAQATLWKPVTFLMVGAALMWLPSTFHIMMNTMFGYASPIAYNGPSSVGVGNLNLAITPALLGLVQFVGLVSFVRGWVMMVRVAEQGQHGVFGKAFTHIVGGVLLINIGGFMNLIWSILGTGS